MTLIESVFDAMDLAYVVLGVVVAIGFLRLLWPQSRAQLPGTILLVFLGAVGFVLISLTTSSN